MRNDATVARAPIKNPLHVPRKVLTSGQDESEGN